MNITELTNAIGDWASELTERTVSMVHDDGDVFDKTTFEVLSASALEVSELEFVLRSGHAERLWFYFLPEGSDGPQ